MVSILSFLFGCAAPSQQEKIQEKLESVIIFGDGESKSLEFVEKQDHIYIPVTIPPLEPKYFMIDTGWSGSSALRSDIVKSMGLKKFKKRKGYDIGGKVTFVSWRVKEVRLGGQPYDNFFVTTCDGFDRTLRSCSKGAEIEIIGILSVRFMEKFFTRIDFDADLITFDSDIPEQPACRTAGTGGDRTGAPSTFSIPFSYVTDTIRAEMCFNDLPYIVTLALDTGAGETIITEEILKNLGDKVTREIGFSGETEKRRTFGAADVHKFEEEEIRVASISLGKAKMLDFPLTMMSGMALRKVTPHAWTDGLLGITFLRNFNMGLDLENKCLTLEKNANYYVYEGDRFKRKRDFQAAEEAFKKAVARKDCPLTRGWLGVAYVKLGDHKLALVEFGRAAEMDETLAWPHREIGLIYHKQKEYQAAEEALRKALDLDSDYGCARKDLAALYADQGRCEEAVETCRPLLEEKPKSASLRVKLGKIYQAHDCHDQAIASYQEAIAMKKDYDWAHLHMGTVFQDRGEFEAALQAYEKALEIDPDDYWAHMRVGLTSEQLGRLEEAAGAYARAGGTEEILCRADLFLYFVNVERGLDARAREALTTSLEEEIARDRKNKDDLLIPAVSFFLGRGDGEAVLAAAKNEYDDRKAQYYLGKHSLMQGDEAGAIEHFRKATEKVDVATIENAAARYELRRAAESHQ